MSEQRAGAVPGEATLDGAAGPRPAPRTFGLKDVFTCIWAEAVRNAR